MLYDEAEQVLLAVAAGVPGWQRDAACVEHPEMEWFVERYGDWRAPQAVCRACLVQADCLAYALAEDITYRIWGGTTAKERAKLTKRGVRGAMVERFGPHIDEGRKAMLDEASFDDLRAILASA